MSVFVALGTHQAMRMRHIVFYNLPRSTILFYTLSLKGQDFRKKYIIEHKMC